MVGGLTKDIMYYEMMLQKRKVMLLERWTMQLIYKWIVLIITKNQRSVTEPALGSGGRRWLRGGGSWIICFAFLLSSGHRSLLLSSGHHNLSSQLPLASLHRVPQKPETSHPRQIEIKKLNLIGNNQAPAGIKEPGGWSWRAGGH